MATARIGTSGWAYAHWRERFYPRGLSPRDYLPYYSQHFDTVEINRSFYRLPTREQFQRWADLTPPGFVFAVKASRLITHVQRLADVREPLAQLLGAASGLGPKLGPVLFQLPPSLAVDLERLDAFLALLPDGVRCVFEFRHPSWLVPAVFERLRDFGVKRVLGATDLQLGREILGETLAVTLAGGVAGALGALALGGLIDGWVGRTGQRLFLFTPRLLGGALLFSVALAAAAAAHATRAVARLAPAEAIRRGA